MSVANGGRLAHSVLSRSCNILAAEILHRDAKALVAPVIISLAYVPLLRVPGTRTTRAGFQSCATRSCYTAARVIRGIVLGEPSALIDISTLRARLGAGIWDRAHCAIHARGRARGDRAHRCAVSVIRASLRQCLRAFACSRPIAGYFREYARCALWPAYFGRPAYARVLVGSASSVPLRLCMTVSRSSNARTP